MTFLYDSILYEKSLNKSHVSKYDLSAVRSANDDSTVAARDDTNIPDSLIPDEFKVVVNHGVVPLKIEQTYKQDI